MKRAQTSSRRAQAAAIPLLVLDEQSLKNVFGHCSAGINTPVDCLQGS